MEKWMAFCIILFNVFVCYGLGLLVNIEKFAILSYVIQWLSSCYAIPNGTEKYYDLSGSIGYIILIVASLYTSSFFTGRNLLVGLLLLTWTIRLGTFLYQRISKDGIDRRFNKARVNPTMFFVYWTIQGSWVFLCLLPFLIMNSNVSRIQSLQWIDVLGITIWLIGFLIECIADEQKRRFRLNSTSKDQFISHGLWKYSRHPNYFGEIVLWWGIFIICSHEFWYGSNMLLLGISMISPIFIYILLSKVSGVPLLEKHATKKWGENPKYCAYKQSTNVLIPFPRIFSSSC